MSGMKKEGVCGMDATTQRAHIVVRRHGLNLESLAEFFAEFGIVEAIDERIHRRFGLTLVESSELWIRGRAGTMEPRPLGE